MRDESLERGQTVSFPPAILGDNSGNLEHILAGAAVGLAVFDHSLSLVTCNEKYREYFRYDQDEIQAGASLESLIRIKLNRHCVSPEEVEKRVTIAKERLYPGASQTFHFKTTVGHRLAIVRNCLDNGTLVETVTRVDDTGDTYGFGYGAVELADMARQRLAQALEGMADGFCLYDADDRLVIYNAKYVEYNPHISDLIMPGASFSEMLTIGIERAGYNVGSRTPEEFVAWRVEQHRNPDAPYDVQLADGRWIRVHEKRTHDGGVVGIRSDISELKKRESDILRMTHELRRKNIQFDTALNNMIQGLCMFDDEQTLVVRNSRYLEMYGFDPEVVKPGIKLREIMEYSVSIGNYTDEDAKAAIEARPDHAKLRQTATLKQRLRDGRVIAVMHQPMPNGGSIATYQDITDLERHETKVREYMQKLEVSNRELEDFAHVASHDLQEPLRKIEAFGGRLTNKFDDVLPDEAKMYVDRMRNASGRMRQLIEDLLDFSRITTKARPFEQTNLNEIVAGVLSDLQIRIEESDADVVVDDLPTIDAEATQMRQLLQNLIGNALKFTKPDERPHVRVEAEVSANGSPPSYMCRLKISDNGIGFDNKYGDQIFAIFKRLHGRTEYEGTGIGLATCRKIAQRHGGEISADGRPNGGATFTVTLPLRQARQE